MSKEPAERGQGMRILLIPEDGGESRSFRVGPRTVRAVLGGLVALAVLVVGMVGSWWYVAARAARADELAARVDLLEDRESQIQALAERLRAAEARYDRIRGLFGADSSRIASDLWLPPVGGGASSADSREGDDGPPTSWPLTRRGFITQPLVPGSEEGDHRGLDIAIPSYSYIRASGGGRVVEVSEDPVYGRYVILDHGDGYRTVYGHAAETLVEEGARVRRNEVIALSGSTGRSSAPHLHFEIQRDGETIDPLSLVQQP